ncbi:MAG: glucuronate isomerase [Deinococcales bacterium]
MPTQSWALNEHRLFSPLAEQRKLAAELYQGVQHLPLICPHGHVPPQLLADTKASFGNPAELFVVPDHYIFRMLYSQGIALEDLGIPRQDGGPIEQDPRKIWQRFAENFHLFQATPTGLWLKAELIEVFGIQTRLNGESAQAIYDALETCLSQESFSPRALFKRFNIEVLCTTDAASDDLTPHAKLQAEGFNIRPTFRPDALVNLQTAGWPKNLEKLAEVAKQDIHDYQSFLTALATRRQFFKDLGATATDHASLWADGEPLAVSEAEAIFNRALAQRLEANDAKRFTAHMLFEMARMSQEDGLVMQLHIGSYRNHNTKLFERFGLDKGADIPINSEWTRALQPILNHFGSHPDFRLILFCLDESVYSRELAPLAGHYPALRLGPPWWFFDSVKGMERYFDAVIETAGIYNLAGFNDDTRAFASIPARHDVWRRVSCNWLAGECLKHVIDEDEAAEMAHQLAYGLAKKAYRL